MAVRSARSQRQLRLDGGALIVAPGARRVQLRAPRRPWGQAAEVLEEPAEPQPRVAVDRHRGGPRAAQVVVQRVQEDELRPRREGDLLAVGIDEATAHGEDHVGIGQHAPPAQVRQRQGMPVRHGAAAMRAHHDGRLEQLGERA